MRCAAPFPLLRCPDVSLRGAKRRGNLAVPGRTTGKPSAKSQLPPRDCTPRALPRASRSGRHVGLRPPRNDKSGGLLPFYRQPVRIGSAAPGAACRSPTGRVRSAMACTSCKCLPEIATAPLGPRNDKSGGHPRFIDGPLITPVQRREGTARPLQGACGRRGRSVILGCAWRSLSAATDAIGACRFNGTLFQSFVQRREGTARPLQGACGRRP